MSTECEVSERLQRVTSVVFNTHRQYTADGQRIAAVHVRASFPERRDFICLVDFSRMITGYFPASPGSEFGPSELAEFALDMYDRNQIYGHEFNPDLDELTTVMLGQGFLAFMNSGHPIALGLV